MVRTVSTMLELGELAPDFSLPNTNRAVQRKEFSLSDFSDAPGLLVVFMCNHCPYVVHIREELARFAKEYQAKGLGIVGICSNDISTHAADSPEKMTQEARHAGYTFPYLFDESQSMAKAYRAACTPDFFLYDADRKLVYRGQFDASRPGSSVAVTGSDLRAASDALLAGRPVPTDQKASMGCNIKWKRGNEPDYFN